MNILDTSSIFNLFQRGKYTEIMDNATIPLAVYEVGNVIWKNSNIKNTITQEEAKDIGSVLFELINSIEQVIPTWSSVLSLALKEGLTFYDSSFLVSAIEKGYGLITDDIKLFRVASSRITVRMSRDL
ncbi:MULTISPECIES: type II toxin-antitoxin system VapC family toxin [Ferroplasma]|jgi:predicted nucleic acid-binding protein|uniref:PIN domain-containing protein n=2 Tax=Ferroplasma TaxID=74968 RepID=S0AMP2_FERAC|nr:MULTISPECIES: type II toxin-antitoxin system VapC family toxin [Ferroplasma]MCL4348940.1 type II toxin-antitoxin system VapC family toxin [Candidatus Thermoplasmatota archaeon]AGO60548.1 hypothetical protein FACI_IFERC00001G0568 [Ferroplasma acidarmanus Fer1]ARD85345.1 PIN-domain RNase, VapC-type toxin [Ferroplasma acidiphilum]NOL60568.1 type II toxin-antitoxin system VapC family toxin [Ferroplasma acidiphilum]WMT52453.1 MAG: type II toxin-antitoxin system VapC family toxin [Ferroplasma aci